MEQEPPRATTQVPIWFMSFLVTFAFELEKESVEEDDTFAILAKILRKIGTPVEKPPSA